MSEIRLNLGCGGRPLDGYMNVDMDSADELRRRYPDTNFPENFKIYHFDIFNLPFEPGTVHEVRADALVEHLSFLEEPKFFYEIKRVLAPGGVFRFSTPDFEDAVRDWLKAEDDWKEFYRCDPEAISQKHWFGNYSYSRKNRWGYLTATIFGPQHGQGQFHKNCYTEGKVRAMLKYLGFVEVEISRDRWKGDRDMMLNVSCKKA